MTLLSKLRVFKRLKELEWKTEMLLVKIALVGSNPSDPNYYDLQKRADELLKIKPKGLTK